jgi:hypothetical protein
VTGQSHSTGVYQSESAGIRLTSQSSFGMDAQTYSNDCGSSCNTDNTATFSFNEVVDTVVHSSASAVGVESSSTSFCTTQISTDNLTAGNSSSITNNNRAGFESNSSLTTVSGVRTEFETSTNGGAEYGEVASVSVWANATQASYSGVTSASSIVTSQSSFMH